LVLIPGGNQRTYDEKGTKQVSQLGMEEKRTFTCLLATSADGQILPVQEMWYGKTSASLLSSAARKILGQARYLFSTNSKTYWSNFETMQEFLKLIARYRENMII